MDTPQESLVLLPLNTNEHAKRPLRRDGSTQVPLLNIKQNRTKLQEYISQTESPTPWRVNPGKTQPEQGCILEAISSSACTQRRNGIHDVHPSAPTSMRMY